MCKYIIEALFVNAQNGNNVNIHQEWMDKHITK